MLDSGRYNGILKTIDGNPFSPFVRGDESWRKIASSQGNLYGITRQGQFLNILDRNRTPDLELDEVEGISGGRVLTVWGNTYREPERHSAYIGDTYLKEFDLSTDSLETRYASLLSSNRGCTEYEGFLATCESQEGRKFYVKKSTEVFEDEEFPLGRMRRIGLPRNLELFIFKKGMRLCRNKISGSRKSSWDSSSKDSDKKLAWEEFLGLYKKHRHLFPESTWKIHDFAELYPKYKKTFATFQPLPYEEAYNYFESQLGKYCKNHAEFERSQGKGYLEGGAIDFVVEQVLGNMVRYALSIHRPKTVAHVNSKVYIGTHSGCLIEMDDQVEVKRRKFPSYAEPGDSDFHYGYNYVESYGEVPYMNYDSLADNPNSMFWPEFRYEYPLGWAKGNEVPFQNNVKRNRRQITAMLSVPIEIWDNGLKQKAGQTQRAMGYFRSGQHNNQRQIRRNAA